LAQAAGLSHNVGSAASVLSRRGRRRLRSRWTPLNAIVFSPVSASSSPRHGTFCPAAAPEASRGRGDRPSRPRTPSTTRAPRPCLRRSPGRPTLRAAGDEPSRLFTVRMTVRLRPNCPPTARNALRVATGPAARYRVPALTLKRFSNGTPPVGRLPDSRLGARSRRFKSCHPD
jgi:hypothetical protein